MKASAPRRNWKLIWVGILAGLAAFGYGVSYLLRPEAYVLPAARATVPLTVPGTVTIFAEYQMELKSAVEGRVKTSVLDIGKKVGRGDVLVQIDTGDVDLEIERIKNEITAAEKKVELGSTLRPEVLNMKDTLDTLERQTKAGSYSVAEFEKQKRLYQQAQQRMELDEVNNKLALDNFQNSLRSKERAKNKMTITNPMDGVITAVLAREGDLIGPNSSIATIITTTRTVEAKLSEENFAKVALGQTATVRFLSFGQEQYNARVSKILPSADSATQRYTVFLDVSVPPERSLVPGLTGEVSIIITQHANAIVIPRRALVGDYVYVLEGSTLSRRKVEKGIEGLKEVEITSGLKEGELVVVEQQDQFSDGQHVRPKQVTN
ncbi:MAG: family efflux transporter, subunit [Lacunisphaera sp.]|nr:family efflux transporter, subunit [Lacunisphaera sp.]